MSDTQTSEWIEHDGKGMPVDGDTIVCIRMRDGDETPASWNTAAEEWIWTWGERDRTGDIIAYRVVKP